MSFCDALESYVETKEKRVLIHVNKRHSQGITVAITVMASGKKSKPLIISKVKNKVRFSFFLFSTSTKYSCQENTWMDEDVMIMWVTDIYALTYSNVLVALYPSSLLISTGVILYHLW